jgi:hypothetical protein
MKAKPLVVRYDIQGVPFALQFLRADDFDVVTLKNICRDLGINQTGAKNSLIGYIENYLSSDYSFSGAQPILHNLIRKSKKWFTFKLGNFSFSNSLSDPVNLVYSEGLSEWYGPVILPEDTNSKWYVKPIFIGHWEYDEITKQQVQRAIRWLVYAKVSDDVLSFHWQGFTYSNDENSTDRESQFQYWNYIPKLIDEFENLIGRTLEFPNLHQFVLHQLWDYYRTQDNYAWTDLRIRAESGGVSLNARSAGAGSDVEIDVKGINHLAHTLSLSVVKELDLELEESKQRHLQDHILQTIIRKFGAKSYEFSLENGSNKIIKAHFYFGLKPNYPSPDTFPHINCHTSWKNDADQFAFIIDQIKTLPKNVDSGSDQPKLL